MIIGRRRPPINASPSRQSDCTHLILKAAVTVNTLEKVGVVTCHRLVDAQLSNPLLLVRLLAGDEVVVVSLLHTLELIQGCQPRRTIVSRAVPQNTKQHKTANWSSGIQAFRSGRPPSITPL